MLLANEGEQFDEVISNSNRLGLQQYKHQLDTDSECLSFVHFSVIAIFHHS